MPIAPGLMMSFALQAAPAQPVLFPPSLLAPVPKCRDGARVVTETRLSSNQARWYSDQLRAAGEPTLADAAPGTVRFTWLRSFHAPVTVRVTGLGGARPHIFARMLSGRGGYAPGNVVQSMERPITAAEATALAAALDRGALFPPRTPLPACGASDGVNGLDGAKWIIERVDARGYHFVDRHSPASGGVRDAGMAMLRLTGWRVDPVY